jgi:sulfonate transport system substrate-binding protein
MRFTTLLFTALLGLAGALPSFAADKPTVIRFGFATVGIDGFSPVAGGSTAGSAQSKGLLDEEFKADGITIEWNFFRGAGPALNEALANGLVDFGWHGDLPSIIGKSSGLKNKLIIANGTRGQLYIAVPSDSPARSLADLKGKRVSIAKGTNAQLAFAKVLKEAGFTEKDFKLINMDGATSRGALATKDLDGAVGGSELFQLRDRGVARIVYSTKGKPAYLTRQTAVWVTESFEAKYPEIVQRFVNVLVKEAVWASDEANRNDVFKTWAKTGQGYSNYKEDYDGTPLKTRQSPLFDEFFVNHYREAVKSSLEFKLIRTGFDVDAWIERKYLDHALKEFKLEGYWEEYDANGLSKAAVKAP